MLARDLSADDSRTFEAAARALAPLVARGFGAWLAGEPLARARAGDPGERALDAPARALGSALAITNAPLRDALAALPGSVVIADPAPGTGASSVAVVALALRDASGAPSGTLDLHCGVELAAPSLARFVFRVHALAFDVARDAWLDPFEGERDRREGILRCAGDARTLLESQPAAALRALRIVAEQGLTPDAELERALAQAAPRFALGQRAHGRSELARMLLGRHAGRALALAERTGLASRIAPARAGVAPWIDALPRSLELRLAAWLAHDAAAWLRDWRFGIERSQRVLAWIEHHPIEQSVDPRRDSAVARLEQRLGEADLALAFALRRTELASGVVSETSAARARAALAALEVALARVAENRARTAQRKALALSGEEVMKALACGPGPHVGKALRHLTAFVAADPARNTPERLREELAAHADASARAADRR